MLVPGDVVQLAAGDMIPADVRLLSAKDLFLTQAASPARRSRWRSSPRPAPARRSTRWN